MKVNVIPLGIMVLSAIALLKMSPSDPMLKSRPPVINIGGLVSGVKVLTCSASTASLPTPFESCTKPGSALR